MPPTAAPIPGSADLARLAAKYTALADLREARNRGAADPDRGVLRALSQAHPGCLRELDTLGVPELRRRAAAAQAAAAGAEPQPWMVWIWAYHGLLAAALAFKRSRAAGGVANVLVAPGEQSEAALGSDRLALGPALSALCARPPGGRLSPLVLGEVAARYGVDLAEVRRTLFPPRRPRAQSPNDTR